MAGSNLGIGGQFGIPPTVNAGAPPSQGMWGNIGDALAGAGQDFMKWGKENPGGLTVAADQIGSQLWSAEDGNPFAGVGTALAQSQMASDAAGETELKNEEFRKALLTAISGKAAETPAGAAVPGQGQLQPTPNPGLTADGKPNAFTAPEAAGDTKTVLSAGKNGEQIETTTRTLNAAPAKGGPTEGSVNLTDVLPLFNP